MCRNICLDLSVWHKMFVVLVARNKDGTVVIEKVVRHVLEDLWHVVHIVLRFDCIGRVIGQSDDVIFVSRVDALKIRIFYEILPKA